MSYVLAIDPGNIESAYVVIDKALRPVLFEKIENELLLNRIECGDFGHCDKFVIEMIAHYGSGMPAGKEVFDTCVWIGRFTQDLLSKYNAKVELIYRKEEKINICGSMRAKDTNIRRALIDRFAMHDLKNGKGTKKNPDWFYGFKADVWAAYAVAVTYHDKLEAV